LTVAFESGHVANEAVRERVEKNRKCWCCKELEEAKAFIKVCPQDFPDLVQATLITGCRYWELTELKASAYDVQFRAISLIQGKTRKLKHVFLPDDEAAFFDK
jgi:integrase